MSRTALFAAAKDWQSAVVRRLLARSPELLAARDPRGRTAFHVCAGEAVSGRQARVPASIATARAFLEAGADIDVVHEIPDGREVCR